MTRVFPVARREYVERVRSKGFVIGTIALPVIFMVLIGISAFLNARGQQSRREIAVVDLTGLLSPRVVAGLEDAGYVVELASRSDLDTLDARVRADDLFGYLILDDLTAEEGAVVFRGKEPPRALASSLLRSAVVRGVLEVRLATAPGAGDTEALFDGGSLEFQSLDGEVDSADRTAALVAGFAGAFLLYGSMLVYGTYVLRSVLEEKRNRVVEIVISSLRPWELMLGKILGVGAVGLTQLSIWLAFVFVVAILALPNLAAAWPMLGEVGDLTPYLPGVGTLALFGVYFVLGYFLYSALFAAVGAICTREEEAQQAQFPIVMLLVIPLIIQTSALEGSEFAWADWAALFPFFSPILMFPRAVAGSVPAWMVVLSIVLMILALIGTAWVAGRIYRVGILMQGKRPTVPEILRWVRAS